MNNRKTFEAFVINQGFYNDLSINASYEYRNATVQLMWESWQAANIGLGALQIAHDLKIYGTDEALTLAGKALAVYQKQQEFRNIVLETVAKFIEEQRVSSCNPHDPCASKMEQSTKQTLEYLSKFVRNMKFNTTSYLKD